MLYQSDIERVITDQRFRAQQRGATLPREALPSLPELQSHALVISGIRRCGKSTLLQQLLNSRAPENALALNFDDPRLAGFALSDFQLLDNIIAACGTRSLFFDEIQSINGWELYVRQKLDAGFRVAITGSNASLLSRELGTRLTGRHLTKELFPFSFREFLSFKNHPAPDAAALREYLASGGFPEYLKSGNADILSELFNDILQRDIAIRHGVRDILSLRKIAAYLLGNTGNLVSANKLRQIIGIKTTATVLEYFSYLEDACMVAFVPRFSHSLKVQNVNPRKCFAADTGLINAVSFPRNESKGRMLETFAYWELRRVGAELFYFTENGAECDFVAFRKGQPPQVIQVCHELTPENREREQRGLRAAMDFFDTTDALILTENQRDAYLEKSKQISIVPAWEFFSTNYTN